MACLLIPPLSLINLWSLIFLLFILLMDLPCLSPTQNISLFDKCHFMTHFFFLIFLTTYSLLVKDPDQHHVIVKGKSWEGKMVKKLKVLIQGLRLKISILTFNLSHQKWYCMTIEPYLNPSINYVNLEVLSTFLKMIAMCRILNEDHLDRA